MLRVAGWWRWEVARTVGEHGGRSRRRSSRNAVGVVGRLLVGHVGCGRSKPRCYRRDGTRGRRRRTRRTRCSKLSSTRSTRRGRGRGREGFAALGASLPSRMRHQTMHSSSAQRELHEKSSEVTDNKKKNSSSRGPSRLPARPCFLRRDAVLVEALSLPPLHGLRPVRVAGVDETDFVSTSHNLDRRSELRRGKAETDALQYRRRLASLRAIRAAE